MSRIHHEVYSSLLNELFPGTDPCDCNAKTKGMLPLYQVEVITGDKHLDGAIVTDIKVKCSKCGVEKTFDVRDKEIYEDDIRF